MKKSVFPVFAVIALAAAVTAVHGRAFAAEWDNLDDSRRVSGRKLSGAYMTGKVVLVSRDASHAKKLQEVWRSFRGKNFILLGTYDKEIAGVTFPVYRGADVDPSPAGQMYVLDAFGDVVYNGAVVPDAIEAAVTAITDCAAPPDYAAWKRYFAFDARELPGRALNRLAELKKDKKFRKAAFSKGEIEGRAKTEKLLKSSPVYARLAKLVAFAAKARDCDPSAKRPRFRISRSSVRAEIKRYEDLKKHEDPVVSREAKNALADLAYVEAEL